MLSAVPMGLLRLGMPPRAGMPTEDASLGRGMPPRTAEKLPFEGTEARVLRGTVIQRTGDEIILEIEVPEDGTKLPSGVATVRAGGRTIGRARIVPEKSTAPGPHPRGVLVRLALRMDGGVAWPDQAAVAFEAKGARSLLPGSRRRERLMIFYSVGSVAGTPPGSERPGSARGGSPGA